MKKYLLVLVTMVLALSLLTAKGKGDTETSAAGSEKTVTLVYAEVNPMDSIVGKTGAKFKL